MLNIEDTIKLYKGDCLEIMKDIPDKSVDMILCDLPYGTTACKWDTIIPMNDYVEVEIKKKIRQMDYKDYISYCVFNLKVKNLEKIKEYWSKNYKKGLWSHYNRIIKDNGAIVLTAINPFASELVMSNKEWFKYEWIWDKEQGTNQFLKDSQPLRKHEQVLVFYKNKPTYNPIMIKSWRREIKIRQETNDKITGIESKEKTSYDSKGYKYPTTILPINRPHWREGRFHSCQKPILLMQYLIETYTNENEIVLDNCMGSGSTGVACLNTNRKFIGIEKEDKYFNIAKERIENTYNELSNLHNC